ncbi:MAG: 16S rRNA (cytosine(1402)-N(4))-methyltransferase RsmH [Candidatus Planktophila sp.]|nr:16S rRNA (cytosine(1402)-N(4))-methyltransferase RsmH [Candidatus Planktophila sp.]MSO24606.1 16S rRNA (cytosine(1402)-N(4))-methyltransferase RsmH [Candidatus Planktophila sp.]PHX70031.1 MAG: 16S rRNA (cytosine(1402)-N(4))-methyltransferase [Actinomycetota bacterium]
MGEKMQHISVMRDRCVELLAPAIEKSENPVVIDATLGLGGHTEALLARFKNLTVIGIDRDEIALSRAKERLTPYADRLKTAHCVFDEISAVAKSFGYSHINGALFDLGVSSIQLDESERGFSYSQDAPLDMRMDRSQGITASEIVNTYEPGKLVHILRAYGEEKFATRIVENIVKARAKAPLNSTTELATLVKESIPAATRRTGGNPAKRTFQALRIEANDELGAISRALPDALDLLMVGGRLVVMSFQSLEDRIVKEIFTEASTSKSPRNLPIELPEYAAKFSLVFRSSQTPSEEELASNPRSASVRLRAIERVAA